MKSVLISIKPKWVEKIANGEMCVCYEKATRPPQPYMFVEEIKEK